MSTILSIDNIEKKKSKTGNLYLIIDVIIDDGTEAKMYIGEGDRVKVYYDKKWDTVKAEKV